MNQNTYNLFSFEKKVFLLILAHLIVANLLGQSRTLIGYDLETGLSQNISNIFVPSLNNDKSSFNLGSINNSISLLSSSLDEANLFEQSQWTIKTPVKNSFDINDFPIRTSIKFFGIENDSLHHLCSGSLVSSKHVFTAAHCIAWSNLELTYDSLLVCPIFDSGEFSSTFNCSYVKKVYAFEDWDFWGEDFAILELEDAIGAETGWISIGYDNQLDNNLPLLHKFSYPNINGPLNEYNGDTLYYSHGYPDLFDELNIGFAGADGAGGESGSSIIEIEHEEMYTSYGVFTWIDDSKHSRLQPQYFYPILEVIENNVTSSEIDEIQVVPFIIYPNPAKDYLQIKPTYAPRIDVVVRVYDHNGRFIFKTTNNFIESIDISFLEQGPYMMRLTGENKDGVLRFVKIN